MRNLVLLGLLLLTVLGYGQFGGGSPTTIEAWKSKTLVVMQYPNSEIYNEAVKKVAQERWYSDKIEYVDYANKKALKKRKDVLVLNIQNWFDYVNTPIICFTNPRKLKPFFWDSQGWGYVNIQSSYGWDYKTWKKARKKDDIIKETSIAYGLEKIRKSSLERTVLLIETLFNTTDQFKKGDYVYKDSKKHNAIYNTEEHKELLKKKVLLIEEKSLPRTKKNRKLLQEKYLKTLYKWDVKIVNEEELQEEIKNNSSDMLYLHVAKEVSYPTFFITDLTTRKIIYSGQERTRPGDASHVKIFERMLTKIGDVSK